MKDTYHYNWVEIGKYFTITCDCNAFYKMASL